MQSALLILLAILPLAQVVLGCAVLRAPTTGAPAMVDAEVLRALAAREQRRSPLVRRVQAGRFDPLRVNRRRQ